MRDLLLEVEGLLPEKISFHVKKLLTITEDIDYEVDHAAAEYGFYAVLAEKAETRYSKMKFAFDQWKAQVETRTLIEKKKDGEKPLTEAQMKAYVMAQPKYVTYQNALQKLDHELRVLKIIAKALELKAGQIQTKSSNRRSEKGLTK